MNTFPALKTGALVQYPAKSASSFSTQVLRFVDGSEQRFPGYATSLQRWTVQLDMLDEDEMTRLAEFFASLTGPAGSFSFTDPASSAVYPDCSFEDDEFSLDVLPGDLGKTTFTIRENRS
jgi:phage-related protein